jgi:cytoskeletal protein RodZ
MTSVGSILRREREAQGRATADLAQDLCITQAYLRAIETDDLASLPGVFFYKSFARQYAVLLGLDPDELRPGMKEVADRFEPAPAEAVSTKAIRVPDPILEAANKLDLSGRAIVLPLLGLIVAIAACSGVYALWNRQPAPVMLSTAAPAPVMVSSAQPAAEAVMEPVQTISVGEESGAQLDVTSTTGADGIRRVVLNLSAKEETWLSITSAGKKIFSGTLEPSETKTLESPDAARMMVGNAGGLEIFWNGKPIGPIGESGQVRVVLFTPDGFEILPPAANPL